MSEYTPPEGAVMFKPGGKALSEPEDGSYKPPADAPVFQPGKTPAQPKAEIIASEPADPQGGPVKAWSASALKVFEQCPYRTFLKRVKRCPEPSSDAAERGNQIHELAEKFVMGEIGELPEELQKFATEFEHLKTLYADAKVEVEQDWGFDIHWRVTDWMAPDVWARIKLDVFIHQDNTSGKVIDHKTGKKFGNEVAHQQQAIIYAIGAFKRYPQLEFIKTEFWYLDHGQKLEGSYTRAQAMALLPRLQARAEKMTSALDFPPKPSMDNCRFCHYAKSGDCEYGFE